MWKEHLKRYFPQNQGGRPQIYSVREAQTIEDVDQSIPCIYITLDNKHVDHQESIIEMEGELCDQVVSILIDHGSNYSYVSLDLVDKCGLNKEVNAKSWLVQLATGTKKIVHHWVRACAFDLNGMST